MSDETTTEAAAPATGKDAIYERIAAFIADKTGKRFGKTAARDVFDMATQELFAEAARSGTVRLNGGFGSLHVKTYPAGERRLPNGETTKFGERQKMRYEEGVLVSTLIDNGGDLEAALASRKRRGEGAAPAEKPAQATKAPETDGEEELD